MTASDYPIFFPYGAITAPYSRDHPHRGDDRACPVGTSIVINGTTIGLTGRTGNVTGPHLHIQEWAGEYANTRKPQNAFKPGTVVNIDPTGTQGDGSFGKFITIQTADGWNDTYCHLSEINVTKGQIIGEDMPTQKQVLDHFHAYDVLGKLANGDPSQEQLDYYSTHDWSVLYADLLNYNHDRRNELQTGTKYTPYAGSQLFVKQ